MIEEAFHVVEIDRDEIIPRQTYPDLCRLLERKGHPKVSERVNLTFRWDDITSPWRKWVDDHTIKGVRYRGKWTTRFQKYWMDQDGFEVPEEALALIGEYITAHLAKPQTLYMEIAKFSDWKHTAFEPSVSVDGNAPGACWWTKFSPTRLGMTQDPRGWSILFYASEEDATRHKRVKGIGRCWLFQFDEGYAIFNAYGVSLTDIARALSKLWGGVKYHKVIIHADPHLAYINAGLRDNEGRKGGSAGYGFLFNDNRNITDLSLPDVRVKDGKCVDCETPVVLDSAYRLDHGHVCVECLKQYSRCSNCGNLHRTLIKISRGNSRTKGMSFCQRCYDEMKTCHFCGKTPYPTYPVWHTSYQTCEYCMNDGHAFTCEKCARIHINPVQIRLYTRTVLLCKTDARKIKEQL